MFESRRPAGWFGNQRSMVLARRGMVCTSQPLASFAGAEILRGGGNAVDAAVGAAAALGVVEPFMTGLGGDCFMLIWDAGGQQLVGLNGSGRAPAAATPQALAERGWSEMPMHGMLAVTVPGAVDAWSVALERFGSRSFADVLAPAIHYAREGYPVSEIIAHQWALAAGLLQNPEAVHTFTFDGRPPHIGEIVRLPALAHTLEALASGGAELFYRGDLARQIVAAARANGGWHSLDDFAAHRSTWVEPISTDYRGYRLYEIPPNGQGLAALIALNILACFDLATVGTDCAAAAHLRIEAVKLAYADRSRYIADPEQVAVPVEELLSKDYAQGRAALIHPRRASKAARPGMVRSGPDTVYLTAADGDGNVVSLINSLFFPFGSGMVAGETGIVLQNRGYGFTVDPAHPNCLAPRKRPFHTIIPAMLFRDQRPFVSFGVMGGDMQAQGHVQIVSNLVDAGANIQEAIDRPRFHYVETDRVALESGLADMVGPELQRMGHAVQDEAATLARGGFGGAQAIMIHPATGVYWGGSDPRKDGCAVGF